MTKPRAAVTIKGIERACARLNFTKDGVTTIKRIQTLDTRDLAQSKKDGGCGECQTSCQSACKTSCGVANQPCEKK